MKKKALRAYVGAELGGFVARYTAPAYRSTPGDRRRWLADQLRRHGLFAVATAVVLRGLSIAEAIRQCWTVDAPAPSEAEVREMLQAFAGQAPAAYAAALRARIDPPAINLVELQAAIDRALAERGFDPLEFFPPAH
jgi:hypothetical protein